MPKMAACEWPCVRPLRGRMPPLPPLRCPGLTSMSPTSHPAPFAALTQVVASLRAVAAPPQRRRSAPRWLAAEPAAEPSWR